jgi:hypothetical protein
MQGLTANWMATGLLPDRDKAFLLSSSLSTPTGFTHTPIHVWVCYGLLDLRSSQRSLWRASSSGLYRRAVRKEAGHFGGASRFFRTTRRYNPEDLSVHVLVCLTAPFQLRSLYSQIVGWLEWQIGKNVEGSDWGTVPKFAWRKTVEDLRIAHFRNM